MKAVFKRHSRISIPADELFARLSRIPTGQILPRDLPILLANQYHGTTHPPCLISGGPETYLATIGEQATHRVYLYVDPAHRSVTVRGDSWHENIYTVEMYDEVSSTLSVRVYHRARGLARLRASFRARKSRTRLGEDFTQLTRLLSAK